MLKFEDLDIASVLAVTPFNPIVPDKTSKSGYRQISESYLVIGADKDQRRTDDVTVVPERMLADTMDALGFVHLPDDGAWVHPRKVRIEPLSTEQRAAEGKYNAGVQCRLMFNGVSCQLNPETFILLRTGEGPAKAALAKATPPHPLFAKLLVNDKR